MIITKRFLASRPATPSSETQAWNSVRVISLVLTPSSLEQLEIIFLAIGIYLGYVARLVCFNPAAFRRKAGHWQCSFSGHALS